jgi:hypothetical protein
MAEVRLYPVAVPLIPGHPNEFDGEATRVLGTTAYSDVDTFIVALEWLVPTTLPTFADIALWTLTGNNPLASTGTLEELLVYNTGTMTPGVWNRLELSTPFPLAANRPVVVQIHTNGRYTFSDPNTFPFQSDDGTLHAYSVATGGNGRFTNGVDETNLAAPQVGGASGYNFFVGIITDVDAGPNNATLTITLPPVEADLSAAAEASATIAVTLPPVASTLDADAIASAALDIDLPAITSTLDADTPATATLDIVLPAIESTLDADAPAGATLAITLPPLAATLDADTPANATLAITLPPVAAALDAAEVGEISATLAITLPPVRTSLIVPTPPPGNPDRMWAPILLALRDCLCAELAKTMWGQPCDCVAVRRNGAIGDCTSGVIPVVPPPPGAERNGIAWVRKTDVVPVLSSVAGNLCVNELTATFELGVVRCIEVSEDGGLGDAATLNDEAVKFESDDLALRRVGRCCKLPGDPTVTLARWQPIFGGGCAGAVQLLTVTARIIV